MEALDFFNAEDLSKYHHKHHIRSINIKKKIGPMKQKFNQCRRFSVLVILFTLCQVSSLAQSQHQQQLPIQAQVSVKPQTVSLIPVPSTQPQPQQQQQPVRGVRTADVFQNGDGYNIFVTNTCERESMKVNIRTGKPFYGVIHTKNQRNKALCTIEGNGDTNYNLEISHVLQQTDPLYCGVTRSQKKTPEDKENLSVVVAFRVHRNIELSDDKFFLLNCTNRCRRPDCSRSNRGLAELQNDPSDSSGNSEIANFPPSSSNNNNLDPSDPNFKNATMSDRDECTIYKFPWLITLLWCLGLMLLTMIIFNCILCSSLTCKCVKQEVEEQEPSVYESDDYDDDKHTYKIEYDNKDIYPQTTLPRTFETNNSAYQRSKNIAPR